MNRENLIVFDWNGTILADTAACVHAMNVVMERLAMPRITRAQFQHHYTMPIANLYHALGVDPAHLENRQDELSELWHATYGAAAIRLRRGARAMLESLRLHNARPIILSNYVTHRIEEQAQKLNVRQFFDEIIAFEIGDATFRKRGKGARLADYLAQHRHTAAIIVGDSEEEIEIGRDHGMVTVAILDGMCSSARLRAMKPDYVIRSIGEMAAIAHRVFGHAATTAPQVAA